MNKDATNANRLLWAGFMAILAAGIGFAIRGGVLEDWRILFGFNNQQLGDINGAGFTGFCFGIIIGGFLADKLGYGKLVIAAFLFHIVSAVIALAATPSFGTDTNYNLLFWGAFLFAIANGTLEAVANPLVATLFPANRTHYLNILHASWPAGLIIGGVIGAVLGPILLEKAGPAFAWKIQLGFFIVPTIIYGLMFFGQKMPQSEASSKGLTFGQMMKDIGILGGAVASYFVAQFFGGVLAPFFPESPQIATYIGYGIGAAMLGAIAIATNFAIGHWMIFVLFVVHAMVGAVELGTDGWIQNITGNILDPTTGKWLFVYTSAIMFSLRFCADFIEKKLGLSPIALLLLCSVLACIGLNLTSMAESTIMIMGALLVYGFGKTFFWPTMLAVVSDRFPKTGAVAISMMGGIGMMSAGLIGSPGLGYFKDKFSSEELNKANAAVYAEVKNAKESKFMVFDAVTGIDGQKIANIKAKDKEAKELAAANKPVPDDKKLNEKEKLILDNVKTIDESSLKGDRSTLKVDSFIPAAMAVIYLGLLLYFASIGGYKAVKIDGEEVKSGH